MLGLARLAALASAFAAFAGVALALPEPPTTVFILDAASPAPTGPLVAKPGAPLLRFQLRAQKAVRLQSGIDAKAENWLGAKLKRPLAADQVLIGSDERPGVYCAPIKDSALYAVAPCLIDADGDGRFEGGLTAAFNARNVDGLAVAENRTVLGVAYSPIRPLATPVTYVAASYQEGLPAEARLTWWAVYDKKQPSNPPQVSIQWSAGDSSTGTGAVSTEALELLPDGAGTVTLGETVVRVLSIEPGGALHYEIKAAEQQHVKFRFQAAPTVTRIFILT